MSEHKEPWRTDSRIGFPCDIHDSEDDMVARCPGPYMGDANDAKNARRIVACVNACAGIPTEILETGEGAIIGAAYHMRRLLEQCDDLVAALKALRSACFDRRIANEEFERMGDLYYREFCRLRPGKDDPLRDSCDEENTKQYNEWSRKRTEAAIDLADAALSRLEEQK